MVVVRAAARKVKLQKPLTTHASQQRLQRSNYIFSGIKTFHELGEAFPSLIDENGNGKSNLSTSGCGTCRPSAAIRSAHGCVRSTTPPSCAPMPPLTGRSLSGTKTSSRTSDGCLPRHRTRRAATAPIGRRGSRCPSMTLSGTSITPATAGTASAPSKQPMTLSTVLMTLNPRNHSVVSRTIRERTGIRSAIHIRISPAIAAVVSLTVD